jgi:3,4-dehydroadipyl-CoA semialdehyde dehydrogenase
MTSSLLPNFFAGRWQIGTGAGTPMFDPVLGTELARVSSNGIDLAEGFAFAREQGGAALRALSYGQRAALLTKIVEVLQANREAYYEIATANSGTVAKDSGVDIDGALFTLGYYAKQGAALGDATLLLDGERIRMAKDPAFQTQHIQVPTQGVALFINARHGHGLADAAHGERRGRCGRAARRRAVGHLRLVRWPHGPAAGL